jgi:uncharacterized protein with HEPN domain
MQNKKDDSVYIKHIIDSILWIEKYTDEIDIENFLSDHLTQDGVIRQLEIIGEASNKLSKEYKDKNPEIPWKDIIGMRNKLIHGYFGVDIEAVWDTVQKDLPELKKNKTKISVNQWLQKLVKIGDGLCNKLNWCQKKI